MLNRKIAISAVSIFAAFALIAGGTYAAFTSEASNTNNTFASGNMVLELNGQPGSGSTPTFTVSGIAPGESETKVITLENTGSVDGSVTKLVNINTATNTSANLGDKLTLNIYDDVNDNGLLDGGDVLKGSAHLTSPAWNNIDLGFGLNAGGPAHKIIAEVTFDADADSSYQNSDSVFNLNFQTSQ